MGFKTEIENNNRTQQGAIDGIRYEQQKVAREHEADQLRIDRINKLSERLEKEFNA